VIKDSARWHGVSDEDMEHARRHWLLVHDLIDEEDRHVSMYVGPDTAGHWLEVGVNDAGDIIHAMPARTKFLPRKTRR